MRASSIHPSNWTGATPALVVVDMQYASASHRDGLGALLKAKGLED
jgi:hypothetical protein